MWRGGLERGLLLPCPQANQALVRLPVPYWGLRALLISHLFRDAYMDIYTYIGIYVFSLMTAMLQTLIWWLYVVTCFSLTIRTFVFQLVPEILILLMTYRSNFQTTFFDPKLEKKYSKRWINPDLFKFVPNMRVWMEARWGFEALGDSLGGVAFKSTLFI